MVRSRPCRTSGSHMWTGARPILSAKAMVTQAMGRGWDICWISHCPVSQAFVVLANRIMAAAVA